MYVANIKKNYEYLTFGKLYKKKNLLKTIFFLTDLYNNKKI